MTEKNIKMFNKKRLIGKEIQRLMCESSCIPESLEFDSIKSKNYTQLGIDYWTWIDLLANLEVIFRKDLCETSEKFKIETVDELINALYNAPEMQSTFKLN
ncbi:MAG: hypothetical protein ACI4N3_05215 [Alphaproteobacteria bacterium]